LTETTEQLSRIREALRTSHVFGMLDDAVLNDLAGCLELHTVGCGDVILREGDVADSMLILLSGRLRVSRRDAQGTLNLYNEIRPGECVGETGMILQQARAADVTAIRDSTLAMLHRESFERLLADHPIPLNRVFSQAIFNNLRHAAQALGRKYAHSFVVIPLHAGDAASEVARSLTEAFSRNGRASHIPAKVQSPAATGDNSEEPDLGWLAALEREFDYLVYEGEAGITPWTQLAFRQADQVIFVATSDTSPNHAQIAKSLAEETGYALKRKHLVLVHPAGATAAGPAEQWRSNPDFERVYLVRRGNDRDYGRLARFITGNAFGLVLGGGGARGFAHIGVLRALEEAGIPIDVVGGNSMGALIGAQYAYGTPLDDLLGQTHRFARGGERPTIPVISLLSGRRIERDLRRIFGETLIERLWLPYFAAACNLSEAVTAVQDSGPLWRAVLASNSPAGLLPPVPSNGQLLVDGAILDNVPVVAMRQRLGIPLERRRGSGTIIAVDVDVRAEFGVGPEITRLSAWRTIKARLTGSGDELPGIGDILYRAGHIGGLQKREQTMKIANHYLQPPVARFPLMAYQSAAEIAEVGYRYAREQIERWHSKAPKQ
jgi:predicted acylesterase/phospholipase RssA/CRP-like cAMP-binding protein